MHPTKKGGSKPRHRSSRDNKGNNGAVGGMLSYFGLASKQPQARVGVMGEPENQGGGTRSGRQSLQGSAFNLYDAEDDDDDDDDDDEGDEDEVGGKYLAQGGAGGSGRGSGRDGGGVSRRGDALLERGYHEGEEPFLYDTETGKITDATGAIHTPSYIPSNHPKNTL